MRLYNHSELSRQIIAELDALMETIPHGDDAYITLTSNEFNCVKKTLKWKTGLFTAWPKYKGVTIISQGLIR